jgi:DNA-binding transcriptional regulator LsrR (DeoR family)
MSAAATAAPGSPTCLCEFSLRLEAAGLASNHRYELPMTQEQLADAVGLTSVHVNRVLKQLGEEG